MSGSRSLCTVPEDLLRMPASVARTDPCAALTLRSTALRLRSRVGKRMSALQSIAMENRQTLPVEGDGSTELVSIRLLGRIEGRETGVAVLNEARPTVTV